MKNLRVTCESLVCYLRVTRESLVIIIESLVDIFWGCDFQRKLTFEILGSIVVVIDDNLIESLHEYYANLPKIEILKIPFRQP